MDVKDEGPTKLQDFHFQQWFGDMAADPSMLAATEPQDQGLQTPADPDDHADQMWNDPPDLFDPTPPPEPEQPTPKFVGGSHSTQSIPRFGPSESVTPQPTASPHPPSSTVPAAPNMQIYSMVPAPNGTPTNEHQPMNTAQPTYYSNGTTYPPSMSQYPMATNHTVPAAANGSNYVQPYMPYGANVSPHQVWQTNGGMVYATNGQPTSMARSVPESPVDPMMTNSATSPPPQTTSTMYSHPQYANSPPVASTSLQPQPQPQPPHPAYAYGWTPEQLRAMQQQQQQQVVQQVIQQPIPRPIPAQAQPQLYRESVVPAPQPQAIQHPRVQQAQNASPMPTMSPTMMHMSGSPGPYASPYGDMFGSPTPYAHTHSPSNPAAINPQALSQPPAVEQPRPQQAQAQVDTIHLYKQYMQPQMMDAAPAQTAKKLIDVLTAEDTPLTDPQTRLWLLTRIRDGAGKEFFKTWANDMDGMLLVKDWLRAATPSKDGGTEAGTNPLEWQETIMPLLQVIDRLPLGINQLRKSKIGSNILKLAKNPPNGAIRDLASSLENRYRSLMESHQATEDTKPVAGKRTEADARGVKRKSEAPPVKTAAPAKRATPPTTTAPTPSPAAAAAARLLAAKREKEKEARAAGSTVTKETKSDSSFFTDTKPKPAPVKRVLPSFTKKTAPPPGSDVAQPSSRNTFEEALAHMGVKPKQGTPTTPSAPDAMEDVKPATFRPQDPSKKRKRVTFKSEEHLVEIRWIEKAIYDDDMDAFGAHHSVRDLDRDEGAAMHKHMVFEELIDWSEPMVLSLPDLQLPERGQQSEEANTQAEREKTALLAHYQPGAIPPWPTEIPPPAVDDSQTKIMLAGEDIDSLSEKPVSVAELLAKINTPAPGPSPAAEPPAAPAMFESLKDLGIDPSTFTQMLQQHNIAPVIQPPEPAPPPTQPRHAAEWGDRMMDGNGGGYEHGSSSYYDDHSHRSRFEDRGRGYGRPRGRGRGGRPDNDRGQKVCYFYPLGKCKYGDQCHNLHVK